MIPDAIEVGRMDLAIHSPFVFGLTLIGPTASCHARLTDLRRSLNAIGQQSPPVAHGFGGNFIVDQVQSLVDPHQSLAVPIPHEWLDEQMTISHRSPTLTIRFLSPFCAQLPRRYGRGADDSRDSRAGYFDTRRFPVVDFARRLIRRLAEDLAFNFAGIEIDDSAIELLDPPGLRSLHWIKWQYGSPLAPKSLFGVMGRIQVRVRHPHLLAALVLGQFTGVGEKTNFGLGRYFLEEVQKAIPAECPPFLRAQRKQPLILSAFDMPGVAREAERLGEPHEAIASLTQEILRGGYTPRPAFRFLLPGTKLRVVAVPSRAERALQRGVHELLAPVLDRFLSDSSIAYRKGLGRHTATERIARAYREGWRWALRSDFHRFFDSVDHTLLREKTRSLCAR
jgi:hypothetical protein